MGLQGTQRWVKIGFPSKVFRHKFIGAMDGWDLLNLKNPEFFLVRNKSHVDAKTDGMFCKVDPT